MSEKDNNSDSDSNPPPRVIKDAYDIQRMKLEKLMQNPEKPVLIPERPKDRKPLFVPDFVRNVMGSSAGAGSGEFHVYRHLRRKEYARQKIIAEMSERERLDLEFQERMIENQRKAEEKTAKKRQKRLKQKAKRREKLKMRKLQKNNPESSKSESSDSESEDEKPENESKCDEKPKNENENKDVETKVDNEDENKCIEEKNPTESEQNENSTMYDKKLVESSKKADDENSNSNS